MKFNKKVKNAVSRGIEFKLTEKQFKRLMSVKVCAYTGVEFDDRYETTRRSLERVDSNKGYIPGNVIPVTVKSNKLKNRYDTVEELTAIQSTWRQKANNIGKHNEVQIRFYKKNCHRLYTTFTPKEYKRIVTGKKAIADIKMFEDRINDMQVIISNIGNVNPWSYYTFGERCIFYVNNVKDRLISLFKKPTMA